MIQFIVVSSFLLQDYISSILLLVFSCWVCPPGVAVSFKRYFLQQLFINYYMNCVWKVIADSQFYLSSVWRGLCLSLPVLEIIFFLVREIYFLVVNGQSFLVIDGYLLNPFRYFSEIIIVILFLVFIYQ